MCIPAIYVSIESFGDMFEDENSVISVQTCLSLFLGILFYMMEKYTQIFMVFCDNYN